MEKLKPSPAAVRKRFCDVGGIQKGEPGDRFYDQDWQKLFQNDLIGTMWANLNLNGALATL